MNLRAPWPLKVLAGLIWIAVVGVVWGRFLLFRPHPDADEGPPPASVAVVEAKALPASPTSPETAPARSSAPKGQSNHPPIVALRSQMLQHFHGDTSDTFVRTKGFGYNRHAIVVKKLFEVPVFSPGDVEEQAPAQSPALLKEAFEESLARFQSQAPATTSKAKGPRVAGLLLRTLDLIGLLDKENPRAYSGGPAFELVMGFPGEEKQLEETNPNGKDKTSTGEARDPKGPPKTRSLDFFELSGVKELLKGETIYLRRKVGGKLDPNGNINIGAKIYPNAYTSFTVVRMLGALRATEQCLKCHSSASKGDLLGALSYTLVDTNRVLFQGAGKRPGRKP